MGTKDKVGLVGIREIVTEAKAQAATATSKAAKKRAYRAAMVAEKRLIVRALLAKEVRTTSASIRACALGNYGSLFLADYDKPKAKAKAAKS
jgi:hypothetical protein